MYVGTNSGFALYRANHKWWKDLKPEIKEFKDLKEFKFEHKELVKPELDYKQIIEKGPKEIVEKNPKEIAEGGLGPRLGGDPYEVIRLIAERVDQISEQLATGKAFIKAEQRPAVGEEPLKQDLHDREKQK